MTAAESERGIGADTNDAFSCFAAHLDPAVMAATQQFGKFSGRP